jgi:excisionase family DNA binding protein
VNDYLTEAELAELLKVSVKTVRNWRKAGTGPPALRLGRGIRYRRRDVEAWASDQAEDRDT